MVVKLLLHADRIWEGVWVPSEVFLAVSVLDVEPDDVVGYLVFIKFPINVLYVFI